MIYNARLTHLDSRNDGIKRYMGFQTEKIKWLTSLRGEILYGVSNQAPGEQGGGKQPTQGKYRDE